ncbi:hypothetical protein GTY54_07055 [Streptomyces sp. SID625]|nr:hypothetical protein [Streptomyces sp. SID625]
MAYTGAVPDTAVRRLDWMEQMACRDVDPAVFEDANQEHEARTICIVCCPARSRCLARVKTVEHGLHRDQRDGVVAGLTYVEHAKPGGSGQSARRQREPPTPALRLPVLQLRRPRQLPLRASAGGDT